MLRLSIDQKKLQGQVAKIQLQLEPLFSPFNPLLRLSS